MVLIPRRSFLIGLGSLLAAPAIVRYENIMPVKSWAPGPPGRPGVPELSFFDSEGGLIKTIMAPSEPIDAVAFNVFYKSPEVLFDVPRTCLIARVELHHPKHGRLQVAFDNGVPRYVEAGAKVSLTSFTAGAS